MEFKKGPFEGVVITRFFKHADERGWLAELFRHGKLPTWFRPEMSYASVTDPSMLRGPRERVEQADLFSWVGPSDFKLSLWDNRPDSPTHLNPMEVTMGRNDPGSALIPKGVVHCYRGISAGSGLVINCSDRLFMGQGKADSIDEIRHEDDPRNPFVRDERARRVTA